MAQGPTAESTSWVVSVRNSSSELFQEADMTTIRRFLSLGLLGIALVVSSTACTSSVRRSAEVGSRAWCNQMDEKPKGDWTANEAADYARNCLLN